jgi:hypothetical protein
LIGELHHPNRNLLDKKEEVPINKTTFYNLTAAG